MVESCGEDAYDFDSVTSPSEAQLATMRRRSPVAHVQQVRTPTLICLGNRDRRVPPSQGIEFFHLLRARGVTTE